MRKTFCATFIFVALILLFCTTVSATQFSDVPSGFWASKEIAWVSNHGLMNGTSATTFSPSNNTLRGQMTAILYRYAGSPSVENTSVYSDVTNDDYYSNAATWAVQNEIMEKTRLLSKTMDAKDPISRAEFCAMLCMYSIYADTYVAPSAGTLFTDTEDVSDTIKWAIEWANYHGIVYGTSETTFDPHGTLSRAAAAAMLYRYENYVNTNPQIPAEAKAKDLVNYYACPFPKMIKDELVNTFGYNSMVAENAVDVAINNDTWKPYAISHAEEFFYFAPKQPTKHGMEQYLVSTLGFDFDVADYVIETVNLPWNSTRTEIIYDWISLSELEDMLFSVNVGWGNIKLNYITNQNYILTGLPSVLTLGGLYYLDFNGKTVWCTFFNDFNASRSEEMFFLGKNDLIDAGILSSSGNVSNMIKNGIPQENISIVKETIKDYTSSTEPAERTSSSSGEATVTVPTHSETKGNLVWVPTNGGTKYHSRPGCSQMENPIQVSIETAKANGYTACSKCN